MKKYIAKKYHIEDKNPMANVDKLAKKYDDVINLSLGDPDLVTNEIIINGAFEDAKLGHTKYTAFDGDPELKEEIIKFYDEEHNFKIDHSQLLVTAGGSISLFITLEAILNDGEEVIIHAPYFGPYINQIKIAGGVPVVLDTFEDEDFQINPDRLEDLISDKTKVIIINTPNNPTGNCFTLDTLEKIGQIAVKHDLLIIADDIYGAYSFSNEFIPFATLEGMRERCITINSFSKDYTMTGWRIGNIIGHEDIIRVLRFVNMNTMFTVPSISQRGAIYALRNRKEIQKDMIKEYKDRTFYAADRIKNIKNMSVLNPKGTFYLLINIKETGLSSAEVSDLLLEEAHIVTIPGVAFGNCGEGYVRIACTVGVDVLKEAFDRIEKMDIFK